MALPRDALRVTVMALLAAGLAVGVVALFGFGAGLREWFGLTPERPSDVPALGLWLHNIRNVVFLAGLACAVAWWPRARWACDAVVCLVVLGNTLLVAVAFGAYGWDGLGPWLPHSIGELLGLAVMTAAYLDARRDRLLRPWLLAGCVVVAGVLLAVAAVVESGIAG